MIKLESHRFTGVNGGKHWLSEGSFSKKLQSRAVSCKLDCEDFGWVDYFCPEAEYYLFVQRDVYVKSLLCATSRGHCLVGRVQSGWSALRTRTYPFQAWG